MDEKTKQDVSIDPESPRPETAAEVKAETDEKPVAESPDKASGKVNRRLRSALIRALAAFVAAAVILWATGFGIITLIKGPTDASTISGEKAGAFVKSEVSVIFGYYDDDYAVAYLGDGVFTTIHLTGRYLESADAIKADTMSILDGTGTSLDKYIVVEGTVEKISEGTSAKMYDWFAENKDMLVSTQLISDTQDAATSMSDMMLEVDAVNGINEGLLIALTALAGLCLIYFFVEIILMGTGFYLGQTRRKKVGAAEGAEAELVTEPEVTEAVESEVAESEAAEAEAAEVTEPEAAESEAAESEAAESEAAKETQDKP